MSALSDNIARMHAEAAAQRVKAAQLCRRAVWWLPGFRALLRLDADALDMGAAELERGADAWQAVLDTSIKTRAIRAEQEGQAHAE